MCCKYLGLKRKQKIKVPCPVESCGAFFLLLFHIMIIEIFPFRDRKSEVGGQMGV
jgi:hypothetical protein